MYNIKGGWGTTNDCMHHPICYLHAQAMMRQYFHCHNVSPFPPHPKTTYAQSSLCDREHVFKACIWTLDSILCWYVCVCACVCACMCVWQCAQCTTVTDLVCVTGNTQWTGKNSYSTIVIKYMEKPGESLCKNGLLIKFTIAPRQLVQPRSTTARQGV